MNDRASQERLEVNMGCPFCDINSLRDRIFYENDKWLAFLAAPYHTKGHTVIAERSRCSVCPRVDRRGWGDLHCMGTTVGGVATALMKCYQPKDILFTSVRGDVEHFHMHLLPLHADEEKSWRDCRKKAEGDSYDRGHLFEFLGHLEKKGDEKVKRTLRERQIKIDELRQEITK